MKRLLRWFSVMLTSILLFSCSMAPVLAQDVKTYIHPRAVPLIPLIKDQQEEFFSGMPTPWYLAGLMEHESCISLRHSKCWNTISELKTSREQGLGLAQLTRAWDKQGKLRFDNLVNMRKLYPDELGELDWDTFKYRADLQIRTAVIMVRDLYQGFHYIKDDNVRLQMTDSAYNGGKRDVDRARTACGLAKDCDPQKWFGHVEKYCVKSKAPLYGDRSPCDINTHHVKDVFVTRMPKFKPYFQ